MNFISGQKKETFFITKNFDKPIVSKSNLILSPEFYWTKRVTLNVNFSYEVKKMAPSLFDGMLPSGDFEYMVFKISKNDYIVTAYNLDDIKENLKKLGISISFVDKIYLAQSEFLGNDISLKVNETCGLVSLDGVLVYTCLNFIDSDILLESVIKNKKLTKNYIYSKQLQNIKIEPKQLNMLIWIVLLLNSVVILDIVKTYKSKNQLQVQKEDFIEKNNLPQTSFELKSMQDELQSIDKKQNDLRESIYYINKFKLNKNESFKSIVFSKNKLDYSVKLNSKQREAEFKKYLSKNPKSTIAIGTNL